jgi:hypothetical protein
MHEVKYMYKGRSKKKWRSEQEEYSRTRRGYDVNVIILPVKNFETEYKLTILHRRN